MVRFEDTEAVKPLYIWPKGADLEPVKRAVAEAGLGFKVRPFWYQPEHSGRALVLADGFPWVWDHIYPKTPSAMKMAVRWCLGVEELERGPRDLAANLTAIFGEVREVHDGI